MCIRDRVEAGGEAPLGPGLAVGAHQSLRRPPPQHVVLVRVILNSSQLTEERCWDSEERREEPDHGNVDGVRPGPGHVLALRPLGVLHEEVVGQEDGGQRQEEEETVVEIPATEDSQKSLAKSN